MKLRVHRFHPKALDPVTVYVEEYGPNSSRITVQCYSRAWTAYWGSHTGSVEQFVPRSHSDYVVDNLVWGLNGVIKKTVEPDERAYLLRIVEAMKEYFGNQLSL